MAHQDRHSQNYRTVVGHRNRNQTLHIRELFSLLQCKEFVQLRKVNLILYI